MVLWLFVRLLAGFDGIKPLATGVWLERPTGARPTWSTDQPPDRLLLTLTRLPPSSSELELSPHRHTTPMAKGRGRALEVSVRAGAPATAARELDP